MREIKCDICGCRRLLDIDPFRHFQNGATCKDIAGMMPYDWDTIIVKRSILEKQYVDMCPDCKEKFYDMKMGAQNTMDATVDAWLKDVLDDQETDNGESI